MWSMCSPDGPSSRKTTKVSPTCEWQHEALTFGADFYHFGIYCLTHLKHTFRAGRLLEMRIYRWLYNQKQWTRTEDGWRIFSITNKLASLNYITILTGRRSLAKSLFKLASKCGLPTMQQNLTELIELMINNSRLAFPVPCGVLCRKKEYTGYCSLKCKPYITLSYKNRSWKMFLVLIKKKWQKTYIFLIRFNLFVIMDPMFY